jgi:hypothetical protein
MIRASTKSKAGCRAFAEKVVVGEVTPAQYSVSSPEQRQLIADFLGVAARRLLRARFWALPACSIPPCQWASRPPS